MSNALPDYLCEDILLNPEKREFPPFDLKRLLGTVFKPTDGCRVCILTDFDEPAKWMKDFAFKDAAGFHDFISEMPQGYDTPVAEGGTSLSGGQRQRIALARAFLKNAPVLILDEATSALDNESEARIQEALGELIKGRTTMIIAHRLSTTRIASRVIEFDRGQIVGEHTGEEFAQRGAATTPLG